MSPEGSSDPIASLILSLLCLAPFCLGILFFLAVGGLIFWVLKSQWSPKDPATLAKEREEMRAELEEKVASLRPWSSGSLSDLSTDWDANWTKLGRDLRARGSIPTLSDPKGPPLVAFSLRVRSARQRDGQMLAATTEHFFGYRITSQSVAIDVDGAALGSVMADGSLLDASNQTIGSAKRPGGQPFRVSIGTFYKNFDNREREYPVIVRGNTIGRLANPHIQMINVIRLGKQEFPPAVVLVGIPSDEEEVWLLALAILQVAGYNLPESLWT